MPDRFAIPATPAPFAARWQLPLTILAGSVAVGVLMSTQFLFQVFVWRHWPWDEVMSGWLEIARDRVVVALAIGVALVGAVSFPRRGLRSRSAVLGAAILTGATVGELTLLGAGAVGAPGDFAAVIGRIARWLVVAGSIAAMSFMWWRTRDAGAALQATELRRIQLERQAATARLAALRVQIEPHFLFNTLATVRRLHQTEPAQGARLLEHFVNYLRSTQPGFRMQASTLDQEIELARAYLGVVTARMSGRLQVNFDVSEELAQLPFPPLTITTLVENAVKHGIAPLPAGGTITVSVRAVAGALEAVVADTGAGFTASSGSGIGLANIRARLHALYGAGGTLQLRANLPRGVRAAIRVPMNTRQGAR